MLGALVGGFLFRLFHIDLGLGEIKITFEDLISPFFFVVASKKFLQRMDEGSRT
jgi:hypothetical protein